ncbi:hypothetical protein HDU76_005472 [Blyttiomyces sp. JEL0837]|nr:hypothetical protein HDU76_005472 [Blyttiomyces sp. JEL0837]
MAKRNPPPPPKRQPHHYPKVSQIQTAQITNSASQTSIAPLSAPVVDSSRPSVAGSEISAEAASATVPPTFDRPPAPPERSHAPVHRPSMNFFHRAESNTSAKDTTTPQQPAAPTTTPTTPAPREKRPSINIFGWDLTGGHTKSTDENIHGSEDALNTTGSSTKLKGRNTVKQLFAGVSASTSTLSNADKGLETMMATMINLQETVNSLQTEMAAQKKANEELRGELAVLKATVARLESK